MMQAYTCPADEGDPLKLPNIEIFRVPDDYPYVECEDGKLLDHGVYFWYTMPGCIPDSYPMGPYGTETEALEEARIGAADEP